MNARHNVDTPSCRATAEILQRVGDKWTVLVVVTLAEKPLRFSEIMRALNGISQRMLTLTLRGLERDGFVTRTVFPSVPPRVDYELTGLGHSLRQPLGAMFGWVQTHSQQIADARIRYDAGDKPLEPFRRAAE